MYDWSVYVTMDYRLHVRWNYLPLLMQDYFNSSAGGKIMKLTSSGSSAGLRTLQQIWDHALGNSYLTSGSPKHTQTGSAASVAPCHPPARSAHSYHSSRLGIVRDHLASSRLAVLEDPTLLLLGTLPCK